LRVFVWHIFLVIGLIFATMRVFVHQYAALLLLLVVGFLQTASGSSSLASLDRPRTSVKSLKTWGANKEFLVTRRGGSISEVDAPKDSSKVKIAVTTGAVVTVAWAGWVYRASLAEIFNKDKIQAKTLEILHNLDGLPKIQSYTTYALGMAIWEVGGLSTIPVETAAGMVFGWQGCLLSAGGKLLGAVIAFLLGRHGPLATWVQQKLKSNSFLQLVEESTGSNPLKVAFLIKLSCFPETIKNYGSAILFSIKLWMFTVATIIHGGTFSALWTYLGVDAAKRLADPSHPSDPRLQFLLVLAMINGVIVSPLAMAYWVRSLKATSKTHAQ
jgi:uncharacterized membrane protein YdjX (TVP38/TMEM64 family)